MRDEEEQITRYVRRVIIFGMLLFLLCVLIRLDTYAQRMGWII